MDLILNILKDKGSLTSNKLPNNKLVLVLGDNETGKTSLIAKAQGNDDAKKGSGLEYHHLLVRDEYRDEQTRLGVWVLDGDLYHTRLLKFPINEESFPHTTLVLVASMSTPWNIIDSLEKWVHVFEQHVESLKIKYDYMKKYKQNVIKRFLEYVSPGDENEINKSKNDDQGKLGRNDDSLSQETLGENVLIHNLGIDVIVVITKTDYMTVLEQQYDYKEEKFDFIQQAIRKFCLKYGASLFYVSAKVDKNCDLLYKYLVHRIYGFPFKTPGLVMEKDAVFIPAGWDKENKISILYENIKNFSPDDKYNDVILAPDPRHPMSIDAESIAEDDNIFLSKLQTLLNQSIPVTNSNANPVQNINERRPHNSPPSIHVTKNDPQKTSPGNEGVLQNFFNNLLTRKPGVGNGPYPRPSTPNTKTPESNK